jgi:hypothetical protein
LLGLFLAATTASTSAAMASIEFEYDGDETNECSLLLLLFIEDNDGEIGIGEYSSSDWSSATPPRAALINAFINFGDSGVFAAVGV